MFRVPVYPHKFPLTDFLVIRTRTEFSIRQAVLTTVSLKLYASARYYVKKIYHSSVFPLVFFSINLVFHSKLSLLGKDVGQVAKVFNNSVCFFFFSCYYFFLSDFRLKFGGLFAYRRYIMVISSACIMHFGPSVSLCCIKDNCNLSVLSNTIH
jgi:hypothetical protein